jgi:hypothetical protein
LVAGVGAGLSAGGAYMADAGYFGYTVAKYSTYYPIITGGLAGQTASSPLKLIPDSFFTNYDTTSSSYGNSILVNSIIDVGGSKSINLVQ